MEAQSADSLASQFALRVALQTMKERCIVLQRRLMAVEEENQQLRERMDDERTDSEATAQNGGNAPSSASEVLQLRLHVAELNRQKTQLSEHINMVSNENRKLWSRLSQMAKEQGRTTGGENDCTLTNTTDQDVIASPRTNGGGCANQNLIRSKTFTQHSPNPNLRHKVIASEATEETTQDASLEEVALNAYDGRDELIATADEVELGFAYLNVDEGATTCDDADEADFNIEAKKCIEGLQEIRREAIKQQQELNSALTVLESRIALQPCAECAQKANKPEMADKSLETDDSLSEVKLPNRSTTTTTANESVALRLTDATPQPHLNILEEKIKADNMDKICPMCGKLFSSLVTFESFQQHVEVHFIDDSSSEIDPSMERTYEFISHTVGDF